MIVPPRTRHRPTWYFTSRSATPGLSTDIQHGPIGFRGLCRTLQTRECTCQLEIKTFSPRSAHALIDYCLCLLSRKRYPFRCFINSGMAGRQISSRIRTSKYSRPNQARRYWSSRRCIKFHVLPPFRCKESQHMGCGQALFPRCKAVSVSVRRSRQTSLGCSSQASPTFPRLLTLSLSHCSATDAGR